ncbi:fungal-specific transcription factor domain-containing protein [Roridomyces roridus]|uniref:Fungal-specific transcription factor domain-containing protein n=1 Tax=Roridomyces roridus TaxID=1738132 RepID=A0AAD7BJU9_9AGAR|nr:fungal-specific transcription factor domain-containing protein [Roridomyces roridus]
MSDNDELDELAAARANDHDSSAPSNSKKRRLQRACDHCRKKKVRCDGATMPQNTLKCSNCVAYNLDCSYVEAAKKRGPPKAYIERLEIRVEKIEALLHALIPESDLRHAPALPAGKWQPPPPPDDDERAQLSLSENLQQLSLNSDRDSRWFGRSSGAMLLQTALNVGMESEPQNSRRHTDFWASRPSPEPVPPPQYDFPPPDLAASLVDLYFTHVNLLLPLLHRPTFLRDLAAGRHLTNDGFAATFLLVCAIGSRFSTDSRVLLEGTDSLHSCGWHWFKQLQLMRDPLGPPPCLYDLQFSALSVIFLHGTSAPDASWTLVSIGIRMAQDVGAHRRKDNLPQWTPEDESWKRAFWVLVFLDRMMSAHLGRPCAIQDEDFDLDYPIDCDDEYWETSDPAQAFRQPKGKPSRVAAFIAFLRLFQILSFALRTIYSINKSKVLLGLSKGNGDWDQRIVVELDAALNRWVDDLPDHLRWNPSNENADFFEQSATLHCNYYHLQIVIHRPYIPTSKTQVPSTFPSLAMSLNAARSCSHIADIYRQRVGDKPLPLTQMAVCTAGVVLLLNIWGGQRGSLGLSTDSQQEMADVQRCMQVLRGCEMRWPSAGKLWDTLYELASVGQLPLPSGTTTGAKNKRERGAEDSQSTIDSKSDVDLEPRVIAGRRRPAPTDVPNIMTSFNDSNANPEQRRLHTSDVPAIMTHFLPRFHQSTQGYEPETPLSSTSLRHGRFTLPEPQRQQYAGGPETPLSSSSSHSHHPPIVPSMQREDLHGRTYRHPPGPPETSLSASRSEHGDTLTMPHTESRRQPPGSSNYLPSMREGMPPVQDLFPPRDLRGVRPGHEYSNWTRGNPSTYIPPSAGSDASRLSVPEPPGLSSTSYPMSEAFYEQITASFSSEHRRQPLNYQGQTAQRNSENETMAIWSAAPAGFEMDDWGTYLDTVDEMTQGRMHGGSGPL